MCGVCGKGMGVMGRVGGRQSHCCDMHLHTHTHTHTPHTHTGMVEDAKLPYSDVTDSDPPSMEEMREIVCTQEHRPLIPDQWNRDEVRVWN